MASIKFIIPNPPKKTGLCSVFLQVISRRQKGKINIGIDVSPAHWDHASGMPTRTAPNYAHLQRNLHLLMSTAQQVIFDLQARQRPYSIGHIIDTLRQAIVHEQPRQQSFQAYAAMCIDNMLADGRAGNAKTYKEHMQQWHRFTAGRHTHFDELTPELLKRFIKWTTCSPTTTGNYLRTYRAVYNKAITDSIIPYSNPFRGIMPARSITAKRNIGTPVVIRLQQLAHQSPGNLTTAQHKALLCWLGCFYMQGCDFIDLCHLTHLSGEYISFIRRKTGRKKPQPIRVKITPMLASILNHPLLKADTEAPYLLNLITTDSNTTEDGRRQYKNVLDATNRQLRSIQQQLNINRKLTLKMSRHTWASIAQEMGAPTAIISAALGHSLPGITNIYIEHSQQLIDEWNSKVTNQVPEVNKIITLTA